MPQPLGPRIPIISLLFSKAEGEVLIETPLMDEKLDESAEEKGGDEIKKQEDKKD